MLAHLCAFYRIFSHFFGFLKRLKPSYVFLTIFFDFGLIFRGFERVLVGFWEGFGRVFGRIFAFFLRIAILQKIA